MEEKLKSELKSLLQKEEERLLNELSTVGTQNPDNPLDWEGVPEDTTIGQSADPNSRADSVEDYENNRAIVAQLEARLTEVKSALEKMESGTYGICEVSGEEIEEDRLRANPAARTSIKHMYDK